MTRIRHCDFYWGSHGCDRANTVHTLHVCGDSEVGLCSEYDETDGHVRHMSYVDAETETMVGWSKKTFHGYGFRMGDA